MTKRSIENRLDDLGNKLVTDSAADVTRGVTAPFVTYDDSSEGAGVSEGWTTSTIRGRSGAVYHVVKRGGTHDETIEAGN